MSSDALEAKVRGVLALALQTELPPTGDIVRVEFDVWDSFKHVEIIFLLEDELGVRFAEDEIGELSSLVKIVNVVERHLAA